MNTSYKLLSIHLDRITIPSKKYEVHSDEDVNLMQDYSIAYNLFDYDIYQRKISSRIFLQQKNSEELNKLIGSFCGLNRLAIMLDFSSPSSIVEILCIKRILQSMSLLKECYPRIICSFHANPPDINHYQELIDHMIMV
ncbi:MAG: hypothetical protein Q4B60_09015 [Erysipelotrichaceae bacterium]|nr:hypothetical protein [Erysipelotrichaceae bacterium]